MAPPKPERPVAEFFAKVQLVRVGVEEFVRHMAPPRKEVWFPAKVQLVKEGAEERLM